MVPTLLSDTVAAPIRLVVAAKCAFNTARSGPAAVVVDGGCEESEPDEGADLPNLKEGASPMGSTQADAALSPGKVAAAAAGLTSEPSGSGELEVLPERVTDAPYTM